MSLSGAPFLLVVLCALVVLVLGVIVALLFYDSKGRSNKAPKAKPTQPSAIPPQAAYAPPVSNVDPGGFMPSGNNPVLEWEDHGKRHNASVTSNPFTIGRSTGGSQPPDLDIGRGQSPNPDKRVSRRHAVIKYEGDSFWVSDPESKNGLILNERVLEPAKWFRLRDADCIQLADFEIHFRHKASQEELPVIGNYDIHELLGKGGMAAVYRASTRGSDGSFKMRAIKVPIQYGDDDEAAERRLSEEFSVLREIGQSKIPASRYVVRPIEEGRTRNGRHFFAMECLEGGTLKDYLRACGGTLDETSAASVALQIATALQAVEAVHRVHCDVKLDNVLFRHRHSPRQPFTGDELRLIDFGISRKVNSAIKNPFGAANYMSPEHIIGQALTTRSDVYSLGCMLYELVSGSKLFPDAENTGEIKAKQLSEAPKSLAKRVYESNGKPVSEAMNHLVMRMLEKPSQSRPSLEDVVHRLQSLTKVPVK